MSFQFGPGFFRPPGGSASHPRLGDRSARLGALAAVLLCFVAGCATRNVNPPVAKPDTGYLDCYASPFAPLSWEIVQVEKGGATGRTLYSEYEPLDEPILRLALRPGSYSLRVNFFNRMTMDPAVFEVTIRDGLISPVKFQFAPVDEALVTTKRTRAGGTYYGLYGRGTKIRAAEESVYRVTAQVQDPMPYLPKARMQYGGEIGK